MVTLSLRHGLAAGLFVLAAAPLFADQPQVPAEVAPAPPQVLDGAEVAPAPPQVLDGAEVAPAPLQVLDGEDATLTIDPTAAFEPLSPRAEVIYRLLVGELAGKRGQLDQALTAYRQASRASRDPRIAARATGLALFLTAHEAALESARRWFELDGDDPQARQALILALLRNGRVAESLDHLEAVHREGDTSQQGYALVKALVDQVGDGDVALATLKALVARRPQHRYGQYYLALTAVENQAPEAALEALATALDHHPDWTPAHLLRAQVLLDRGEGERAVDALATAVTAQPQDRDLRLGYARLLHTTDHLHQARTQLEALWDAHPEDDEIVFALGRVAFDQGRLEDASEYYRALLALGKRVDEAHFELGRLEENREDYAAARHWYSQIDDGDYHLNAQVRIAAAMAKQGSFDAMAQHMVALRRDNPASAVALYLAEAEILRTEARYPPAMALLDEALTRHPNDTDLLYSRALMAERLDRLDWLERDLRTILELDPDNGHALNALGYTLTDRTDRHQEALGYIERAYALLPNDAAVVDSMGWVHYRLGNLDKALTYLRRAYDLDPDPEIGAHLSEVLWYLGKRDEARTLWQRAVEASPDSEHLLGIKSLLEL